MIIFVFVESNNPKNIPFLLAHEAFFVSVCFNVQNWSKHLILSICINVIDVAFFMKHNMKIFFKFLAFFWNHGIVIASKKPIQLQKIYIFSFYPPYSSGHIQFKWDLFYPIKTSFRGLCKLFVKGKFKIKKRISSYRDSVSSGFFGVKGKV